MMGFFQWCERLYNEALDFLYQLMLTLITLLKDLFLSIMDSFLDVILSMLQGLAYLFEPMDISSYINGVPPSVAGVMSLIGLPQAMIMITTAIIIRLTLQLIPFTRLGS